MYFLKSFSIFSTSLDSIESYAFAFCMSFTHFSAGFPGIIGVWLSLIGDYAFAYCANLVSISILGNADSIKSHAFSFCYNLRKFDYYGSRKPKTISTIFFFSNNLDAISVSENYKNNLFGEKPVKVSFFGA